MTRLANALQRPLIHPERLRSTAGGSFAFLPHRFLRDGFFASLHPDELRLYLFLVLAADRHGLSFYHYDSICAVLEWPLEAYLAARNALIAFDLVAFDGSRFQVLSLPEAPVVTAPAPLTNPTDFADHDPTAIRQQILNSLRSSRDP
ncbi:MAG: hypothetical protein NW223_20245 [Hyphomicrobiaceae bacterium]|nr:hypothetical protein [Hyphomicrobiaceae bacterium]